MSYLDFSVKDTLNKTVDGVMAESVKIVLVLPEHAIRDVFRMNHCRFPS